VDILIALVMHTGAVIGAQIGVVATQYFSGPKIRLAFVPLPLIGAAIVIYYARDRPQALAMKILICSDGTSSAQTAIDLGGLLAGPLTAETTLLGIAERSEDEQPLREALHTQAQSLRQRGVSPNIVVQFGEPVLQIVQQTSKSKYDLVVIGARWTGAVGHYWRSKRTYEVIKAVQPPVLVAIGERKELKRFVVCTGGKEFIEQAVQFTGKLAAAAGASVTLLHVMAEPPAMFADLVRMEENVDQLLQSNSETRYQFASSKRELDRLGVSAEVHIRHGIVIDQVFRRSPGRQLRFDVTGTIAGARPASTLHHGRFNAGHFEPCECAQSSSPAPARPNQLERSGRRSKGYSTNRRELIQTSCVIGGAGFQLPSPEAMMAVLRSGDVRTATASSARIQGASLARASIPGMDD